MKKNILLIDDEELITLSLQKLLSRQGYEVAVSNDVASALEKIKTADFDLIVSDVRMPGTDGVTGVEQIRAATREAGKPLIPEVIITGYADLDKYQKAMTLNVAKYLYKPFDNNEFLAIVRNILGGPEDNGRDG